MPDFVIEGLEKFRIVGEFLREEGAASVGLDRGLKRSLASELRKAGAPVAAEIKAAYREKMPKAGGLNEHLAGAKVGVRNRFSGPSVGMTVVTAVPGYDLEAIEKGDLRHPVFGHGPWVSQEVPDEVAGRAFERMAPEISLRVDAAVEKVIAEIEAV